MKRAAIIVAALLLTGCAHTAPSVGLAPPPAMPTLPPALASKAKPLPPLTGKSLGEREKEDAAADAQYNATATQLNALIDAWECVRAALNSGGKIDAGKCL